MQGPFEKELRTLSPPEDLVSPDYQRRLAAALGDPALRDSLRAQLGFVDVLVEQIVSVRVTNDPQAAALTTEYQRGMLAGIRKALESLANPRNT